MAGRPSSEVDANEILYLKRNGMPMKDIAQLLRVSRQTLYNTIRQSGSPSIFGHTPNHVRSDRGGENVNV